MNESSNATQWTEEEVSKLYDLKYRARLTNQAISGLLKRPFASVKAKIQRMKPTFKQWAKADKSKRKSTIKAHALYTKDQEQKADEYDYKEKLANAIDQAKIDLVTKNDYKTYNDLLRKTASTELIIEKFTSAVQALPPVNIEGLSKYRSREISKDACEDVVLLVGDVHCGNCVLPEETFGLGNYNMEIYSTRMDNMIESVIKIANLHRKMYNVKRLHIFCLGDLVQGMNGAGKWSPVYIEQDVLTQVFVCMEKFAASLAVLGNAFEHIDFYGVYGNHGRTAQRGIEKDFVNWDYVMYRFLEKTLQNQPNLSFHINKSWMAIAQVQNSKFLLVHGDDIKGWAGIPFYGIARSEGRYRSLLEQFKSPNEAHNVCKPYIEKLKKNPDDVNSIFELINAVMIYTKSFDYLVLGHFHSAATWFTNSGGRIIANGAFYSGDVYSMKQLQAANPAVQKLFGVNKKGITWQYDLELDRD